MKVTIADVISLNGKITKGDDPGIHSWSSSEDWDFFISLRDASDVIVMDRHTYETVKPAPEQDRLRIVLTSQSDSFKAAVVPGQLEFYNESPESLVSRLAEQGYKKMLVAGGGKVCSEFFAGGLVDEFYLTLEPFLFGTGRPMLAEHPFEISLQLQTISKLNTRGTLLAHYTVEKATTLSQSDLT